MHGLGDNIYQRAFMRFYPGNYIRTPWPELYQGLNVRCVRSCTELRTQQKHELSSFDQYHHLKGGVMRRRIAYGAHDLKQGGVIETMRRQFGVNAALTFDLPSFNDPHPLIPPDRVAVIRPATVRTEWASASRNPDPGYLYAAADWLRKHGFFVVSVADLEPDKEWIVGDTPPADLRLHAGELTLTQLCTLYERADCVVSPVGFSVPMAIAYNTPLLVVAGGRGGHNAPEVVTAPEMNLTKTRWAIPDNYCRCTQADHGCNKTISDFEEKFNWWLNEIVLK
ncbi:hypothetical protein I6H07_07460 [Hafnia alvei]|nr:hypothetical protein [Hafnia alvei]PNL03716.1 hypothetical protein CEQ28_012515 [Hafnia alvei]